MGDVPSNAKEVFDGMGAAFKPEAAAGIDVCFQYKLSGEGGGDYNVTIKDQTCTIAEGVADNPTTTIIMAFEDFLGLLSGQLDAMMAFTTGKLKIEGDMMKAQLMSTLFEAPA